MSPSNRDHGELDTLLRESADAARAAARHGKVADYIPSLARMDPETFGFAAIELDGTEHAVGDADEPFAIQSISKMFSLVLALRKVEDADQLWSRVGREPSGDPFNSLLQLEREAGIPRNPMINAGALLVNDVLYDCCEDVDADMIALLEELTGEDVGYAQDVLADEMAGSPRNRAMANLMASFGNFHNDVDTVLDIYLHECSIALTTRQLARAVRFLANDGVNPLTGEQILDDRDTRRVAAIMLTCGTYDAAGEFAYSVGLPCKSGVAGAIAAIATDQMGLAVWSPPLDATGNSVAGRLALHEFAERLGISSF